jgi:hypothetical protein
MLRPLLRLGAQKSLGFTDIVTVLRLPGGSHLIPPRTAAVSETSHSYVRTTVHGKAESFENRKPLSAVVPSHLIHFTHLAHLTLVPAPPATFPHRKSAFRFLELPHADPHLSDLLRPTPKMLRLMLRPRPQKPLGFTELVATLQPVGRITPAPNSSFVLACAP